MRTVPPIPRARGIVAALLPLLSLLPGAAHAGDDVDVPRAAGLEVAFGAEVGSEEIRRTLEREVLREFDDRGCFDAVQVYHPSEAEPPELLLRVLVEKVDRETVYDTSIAQRSAPDAAPEVVDSYETRVEASIRFELLLPRESLVVRQRKYQVLGRHRPEAGEDASAVARLEMIQEVAQDARTWACKGYPKKLARAIEASRSAREGAAARH